VTACDSTKSMEAIFTLHRSNVILHRFFLFFLSLFLCSLFLTVSNRTTQTVRPTARCKGNSLKGHCTEEADPFEDLQVEALLERASTELSIIIAFVVPPVFTRPDIFVAIFTDLVIKATINCYVAKICRKHLFWISRMAVYSKENFVNIITLSYNLYLDPVKN